MKLKIVLPLIVAPDTDTGPYGFATTVAVPGIVRTTACVSDADAGPLSTSPL